MGNIASISNMLKKVGATDYSLDSKPDEVAKADKIILPGVGAFDNGMMNLQKSGLLEVLNDKVLNQKTVVLGICLGMQLLTRSSEEGKLPGLGWIEADTKKFKFPDRSELKIPHMGWNYIKVKKEGSLFVGDTPRRFYFVHSYYVHCQYKEDVLAETNYGFPFTCAVQKDNVIGVQFHPEKSHHFGMSLFENFLKL